MAEDLTLMGPTTEMGRPGGGSQISPLGAIGSWTQWADGAEDTPQMRWPQNVRIHEQMLFQDSGVQGLFLGLTLPILNYTWWIEPGDDTEMSQALADDLGLPLGEPDDANDEPATPGLFRFDFGQHLSEALLALGYGHYYFEMVGVIGDDGLWHLRKLGPRAPQTIAEFLVAEDGGLHGIRQNIVMMGTQGLSGLSMGMAPPIPTERLVGYVWRPDARARWTGRSMLRALYKHSVIVDKLMRVDAINHERAGGVPNIETDETYAGADLNELAQLAASFRVGEQAGQALPPGTKMSLLRAGGTDIVGSMRYHDEKMAFAWSAMVRNLGQTATGSRALGDTFSDLEELARRAVARWFVTTFREHVIEDWWEYNVPPGPDGRMPKHPVLKFRSPSGSQAAAPAPVAQPQQPQAVDPQQVPVDPTAQDQPVQASMRRGCRELREW